MAYLKDLDVGQIFSLSTRLTVLGRDSTCDIVVRRADASGRHAIIVGRGGSYAVEDLESLNGTLINGHRVFQRIPLKPGDRLDLPGLSATFHEGEPEGPAVTLLEERQEAPTPAPSILSSLDMTAIERLEVAPQAKLRAVLEISRALSRTLALEEVLPRILESLFTSFPQANRGFILLRDPATGALTPKAVRARHGEAEPLALSRTVIDHALATGRAVLSADLGQDARFSLSESIRLLQLQSVMCVPLMGHDGAAVGVIQIESKAGVAFRQEDLDVLLCASTLAAQAIELAHLHRELRDLEAARRIQRSFLPDRRPRIPGFEFFDHYSPAQRVGGDYFDYIDLPGDRLAVTVGDVAGKGVSAALLMAQVSAAARFCLGTTAGVAEAVRKLNLVLARAVGDDRFVTLLVAVLDGRRDALTMVNAGHPPPLRRRNGQEIESLGAEAAGPPIAGIDRPYEETTLPLEPGDVLIFYTDGVTDARNPEGELFGTSRLHAAVRRAPPRAEELGSAILSDVKAFSAGCPPSDDQTLLCFGRTL